MHPMPDEKIRAASQPLNGCGTYKAAGAPIACDSLIFDMDGTLWDAVDSYAEVWNTAFAALNVDAPPVTRQKLVALMGKHLDVIMAQLAPGHEDDARLLHEVERVENLLMPVRGGRLYHGVRRTLQTLHDRGKRLFMVSNCGDRGLPMFLQYTGLHDLVEDTLAHGQNGLPKDQNIRLMVGRHNLQSPVYVGDTQTDADAARAAGLPFVWAAYGFGKDVSADAVLQNFGQLCDVTI